MSGDEGGRREERRFAAASTAAARTDYIPRDRDPPPTYDGENPETTFRQFKKQVQLWLFETEVPETKRGVKLLRQLTGVAATAVDDMEVSEIVHEQGVKNIMQKLREYFTPHLEVSLPRAFETAVYGTPKQTKETFAEYAKRMERAFTNLAKEGVDLPADARGYILYRQASLTEAQDQKLLTWTQGKYSRVEVTSALRRLDKVVRDKAKSSFQVEGTYLTEDSMGDPYNGEEIYYTIPDEDDENFVYIAEGDLDHVLEESEVMEALASYQEVRQQLKYQRLNRGYFPGKGKGKPNYPAKGKDKGGGKRKIHIEQLKLRTRCRRCGQVGHWEKECQTKPKDDNRAFFVRIEEENAAAAESGTHFWFQQETSGRQAKDGTDVVFDDAERSDVGAYMERQPGAITFCGISTQPHHGVVDTAAEGGLAGTGPLKNIEVELARHALKVRWIPKKSQAKGVGGAATVEGTVLIPIGIAGVNGILECTVVQGDVPLLLPVRMLRALESLIDLKRGTMTLQSHGRIVDLHQLPSGHVTIDVFQFASGKFVVPDDAGSQEDFETRKPSCFVAAMSAQRSRSQFEPKTDVISPATHVGAVGESKATGGSATDSRCRAHGSSSEGVQLQGTNSELASHHGQDRRDPHPRSNAGRYRSLVLGVGITALGPVLCRQPGGLLLGGDPHRQDIGAFEEQRGPQDCDQRMHTSQEPASWGRQWLSLVHRVPAVPFQVGPQSKGGRHPQAAEARPLEHRPGSYYPDYSIGTVDSSEGNHDYAYESTDGNWCNGGSRDLPTVDPLLSGKSKPGANCPAAGEHQEPNGGTGSVPDASNAERASRIGHQDVRNEHDADAPVQRGDEEGSSGQPRTRTTSREAPADVGADEGGASQGGSSGEFKGDATSSGHPCVQMREACGTTASEEGGVSKEGPMVLEVHAAPVRLLRVGDGGGRPAQRDDQDCGLQEPAKVQEPTEGSEVQRANSAHAAHRSSTRQLDEGHGQGIRDQCRPGGGTMSWTTCSTPKGIRWARKAQKGQHHLLMADEEYMIRDPVTGNWTAKKGLIPKDAAEVQVQLDLTRRGHHEDRWDELKTAGYSRKDRQKLQRAMKEMDIHFGKVSELYSPPRISPEAAKRGLETGACFDLQTAWDLSREEDRRQMWKTLREEKPDVIIVCPPCTAFSRMQALNKGRRDEKRALQVLHTGREHLRLAAAVIRWQLKQGRSIVFERPSTATSWKEDELQELLARQVDLYQIDSHMCAFGMNVTGNGLNLKPTRWLTDMEEVAQRLNRRCDGTHEHEALEGGNKTRLAQVYPPELCRQLAKGIQEHLTKKCPQKHYILEVFAEEESEAEEIGDDDHSGEAEEEYEVSEEEKKMILKVHRAVGHPQRPEFIRFLRAARVKGEIIRWAAKEFKCDVCEAKAHPKAARPTTLPRSFQPGRVLGLDLFYIAAPGGGRLTTPVLNMVDWGTNYQMCELLSSKGPEEIWDTFMSTWARTFGQPEVIVCDAGREFMGHFIQRATAEGIVVHQMATKAPWQAGKTERHGGHFKELLDKARSETVVQDERDLRRLIMEVEQAKNRYSNRSGFAPIQRQIGQWPRLPTAILSDEGVDPMLINGMMVDDFMK